MARKRASREYEHDLIVRALLDKLAARANLSIDYMPRGDGAATPEHVPDIMLRDAKSHRLLRICAIETRSSMTRGRSVRWRELARRAPLTLIVPKGDRSEAERLLGRSDARVVEYERAPNGEVVFRPGI